MKEYNIESLMNSSEIKISRDGQNIDWKMLKKMDGNDLLNCEVTIKNHDVDFFCGAIPDGFFSKPLKFGIGYHYRNVGSCASKENSSAIDLIRSVYGLSNCWDESD